MIHLLPSFSMLAAEPASVFYMLTGALGLAFAGRRKSRGSASTPSTPMLFCKSRSRKMLGSLDLL